MRCRMASSNRKFWPRDLRRERGVIQCAAVGAGWTKVKQPQKARIRTESSCRFLLTALPAQHNEPRIPWPRVSWDLLSGHRGTACILCVGEGLVGGAAGLPGCDAA